MFVQALDYFFYIAGSITALWISYDFLNRRFDISKRIEKRNKVRQLKKEKDANEDIHKIVFLDTNVLEETETSDLNRIKEELVFLQQHTGGHIVVAGSLNREWFRMWISESCPERVRNVVAGYIEYDKVVTFQNKAVAILDWINRSLSSNDVSWCVVSKSFAGLEPIRKKTVTVDPMIGLSFASCVADKENLFNALNFDISSEVAPAQVTQQEIHQEKSEGIE